MMKTRISKKEESLVMQDQEEQAFTKNLDLLEEQYLKRFKKLKKQLKINQEKDQYSSSQFLNEKELEEMEKVLWEEFYLLEAQWKNNPTLMTKNNDEQQDWLEKLSILSRERKERIKKLIEKVKLILGLTLQMDVYLNFLAKHEDVDLAYAEASAGFAKYYLMSLKQNEEAIDSVMDERLDMLLSNWYLVQTVRLRILYYQRLHEIGLMEDKKQWYLQELRSISVDIRRFKYRSEEEIRVLKRNRLTSIIIKSLLLYLRENEKTYLEQLISSSEPQLKLANNILSETLELYHSALKRVQNKKDKQDFNTLIYNLHEAVIKRLLNWDWDELKSQYAKMLDADHLTQSNLTPEEIKKTFQLMGSRMKNLHEKRLDMLVDQKRTNKEIKISNKLFAPWFLEGRIYQIYIRKLRIAYENFSQHEVMEKSYFPVLLREEILSILNQGAGAHQRGEIEFDKSIRYELGKSNKSRSLKYELAEESNGKVKLNVKQVYYEHDTLYILSILQRDKVTHLKIASIKSLSFVFISKIMQNKNLRELDVSYLLHYFGDNYIYQFLYFLKNNNTLKSLRLTGIHLEDKHINLLQEALMINTSLTHLYLNQCQINTEQAKKLAFILSHNFTLEHLDLSKNKICYEGIIAIASMLRSNYSLRSLDVRNNLSDKPFNQKYLKKIHAGIMANHFLSSFEENLLNQPFLLGGNYEYLNQIKAHVSKNGKEYKKEGKNKRLFTPLFPIVMIVREIYSYHLPLDEKSISDNNYWAKLPTEIILPILEMALAEELEKINKLKTKPINLGRFFCRPKEYLEMMEERKKPTLNKLDKIISQEENKPFLVKHTENFLQLFSMPFVLRVKEAAGVLKSVLKNEAPSSVLSAYQHDLQSLPLEPIYRYCLKEGWILPSMPSLQDRAALN